MTDRPAVGTLRIERLFMATADRVFRAWTDPLMAARWLSPVGHAEMVADVRQGGTFSIVMVGDGRRIEHTGEYLDVDRPRLLRFTWRSPYTGPEPSVVTVELFPVPEGVRLVLTHSSLPDDRVVSHEGGWRSMLEQLGSVLDAEQPMTAVDVTTEIEIARPRGVVAAYAADPSNATSWYRNITSVTWRTEPPLAVGSRIDFVARFLGRELAYTYEVRAHVSDQLLVQSTSDGPFAMETTYTWEDVGEGTRMTLRNRGEPSGFSKVARPAIVAGMRRANRADLRRLKELLEST